MKNKFLFKHEFLHHRQCHWHYFTFYLPRFSTKTATGWYMSNTIQIYHHTDNQVFFNLCFVNVQISMPYLNLLKNWMKLSYQCIAKWAAFHLPQGWMYLEQNKDLPAIVIIKLKTMIINDYCSFHSDMDGCPLGHISIFFLFPWFQIDYVYLGIDLDSGIVGLKIISRNRKAIWLSGMTNTTMRLTVTGKPSPWTTLPVNASVPSVNRDSTSTSWSRNFDFIHFLKNHTYNLTDFSASEVLDNHKSVLTSFRIQANSEELDLPSIYWILKKHKNPYKHRFIPGFIKVFDQAFIHLLTKLLIDIKQGIQRYCETAYSRSGVNQMWILRIQKNC